MIDLSTIRHLARDSADRLTRLLLLSAYEASDDAYWASQTTRHGWRSLGGVVEYCPDLMAVRQDGGTPVYLLVLRAAPNTELERLTIKLKVKKSGQIHQQRIPIRRLSTVPVRIALSGLPLKPRASYAASGRRFGDIYIKLEQAIDNYGADPVAGRKIAEIFAPGCMHLPPLSYVERWGQYWNIDAINREKERLKTRLYRRLIQSAGKLWRPLRVRRAAHRVLTNRFGLSLVFWSRNLVYARAIRDAIAQAGRPGHTMAAAHAAAGESSRNVR